MPSSRLVSLAGIGVHGLGISHYSSPVSRYDGSVVVVVDWRGLVPKKPRSLECPLSVCKNDMMLCSEGVIMPSSPVSRYDGSVVVVVDWRVEVLEDCASRGSVIARLGYWYRCSGVRWLTGQHHSLGISYHIIRVAGRGK